LLPTFLREPNWAVSQIEERGPGAEEFLRLQIEDSLAWQAVAARFSNLAVALQAAALSGAALAKREAATIELAAELIVSCARFAAAAKAFRDGATDRLRHLIEEEVDARERALLISGRVGYGGGVNPVLVSEDIQNMRFFLADDRFPNMPDDLFHMTATPYST
jgi:hypothetical protein